MENSVDISQKMQKTQNYSLMGWIICSLAAIFYCYEYLLRIIPSVMVPELMEYFQVQATALGTLTAMYYLAYTPMQVVVGVVTDMYGPRRILSFAVAVCALGSLIFGNTTSLYIAGMGRFLMGLGSSFAFVGVLKLASIWLPLNRFAFFAGLTTALGMAGAMIGDIVLVKLVQAIKWQPTILIGTIVGIILTPIIWLVVRDTNPQHHTGNGSEQAKLGYKETLKELLQIVKNSQMWICGAIGAIQYLSLSLFAEFWGIPFLQTQYSLSPATAALANSMVFFGWLIGSPLLGWISDKIKIRRMPLFVGSALAAMTITIVLFVPSLPLLVLCALLFLFGLFCSAEVICFAIGRELNNLRMAATSVAFINMVVMLGGLISQPLIGLCLDWHWAGAATEAGSRIYSTANYQWALTILPICLLVSVVLTFIMRESYQEHP